MATPISIAPPGSLLTAQYSNDLLTMYRAMLLARALDERMWLINRQGTGNFAVPGVGHEAIGVGYAAALEAGRDFVYPHYRDLAALIALGMTAREVMLNYFAKVDDPCSGGRQMYAHWGNARLNVLSLSSPQPNHVTHAVGMAYASKLRRDGRVTWCGFGEGASSKGDVHEGMNFAGIHKVPIVFCCENNVYAISTHQSKQMAIQDVAIRARGYGFEGVVVDGNDPLAVYEAAKEAVDKARAGSGPMLIEAKCYRFLSHTSNDDDRDYRTRDEIEAARRLDPIAQFRRRLLDMGALAENDDLALQDEIEWNVEDAIAYAERAPEPEPADLFKHIYA